MHFINAVALSLPVFGVMAAPRPQTDSTSTASGSTTAASGASTYPTSPFGIISVHSTSKIHLLPWTASGSSFYLGGNTATYCPESVGTSCPNGTATAFSGLCSLDTEVPGGQQIYLAADGHIGFTQAHSASSPPGSHICPLKYEKEESATYGTISLNPAEAFGATSFMGCLTDSGFYQVFAALQNATVPQGNVSNCISFEGITANYSGSPAWQYT